MKGMSMMLLVFLCGTYCYAENLTKPLDPTVESSSIAADNIILEPLVVKMSDTPCVTIAQIHFSGLSQFPLISADNLSVWKQQLEGQCVGNDALLSYADYLNEQLSEVGYITSYIHYPKQALLFGVLNIKLIAGTLSKVTDHNGDEAGWALSNAFPVQEGQVIDLYSLNQGLMNLRNTQLLPYQIEVISDNAGSNTGRLVVLPHSQRAIAGHWLLEAKASIDRPNSVARQIVMLANPLLLNDFLYLSAESDLNTESQKKLKSAALFYSIPYHYWLFSLYAGYEEVTSHINLPRLNGDGLQQNTRSRLGILQAEHFVYRTANSMTSVTLGAQVQTLDLFLDQYRLNSQQRFSSYGLLGVTHKYDFTQGSATIILKYKQGMDWFGATASQVTGLDKARIYQLSADVQSAFTFMNQSMYHRHELEVQFSQTKLDKLLELDSITGNLGIRGFTSGPQIANMGDNSLKLKNELGWLTPWQNIQLYGALDFAATSNKWSTFWRDNRLVGTEMGVRGQFGHVSYQLFFDAPIWKSMDLKTDAIRLGGRVGITY